MAPRDIHIIGVDPGGTTGWALLTVPRNSIYGREPGEFLDYQYGEITGPEPQQVRQLGDRIRQIQSLDYKIGPAVIVEDFDLMAKNPTTDAATLLSPVRIAAMLVYAQFRGELSDARVVLQSRAIAKETATDERLQAFGLYVEGSRHVRDATRHAWTAIKRAKQSAELRSRMWDSSVYGRDIDMEALT